MSFVCFLFFFRCTARRWPVRNELFFIHGAVDGTSGERFLTITFRISSVKYCVYFLVVCLFFPRSRIDFQKKWTRNIKNKRHALRKNLMKEPTTAWALQSHIPQKPPRLPNLPNLAHRLTNLLCLRKQSDKKRTGRSVRFKILFLTYPFCCKTLSILHLCSGRSCIFSEYCNPLLFR